MIEEVAAGRGVAVEGLVDLAVGRVNPDLERPDPHGASFGNRANVRVGLVRQPRLGDLAEVDAVGLSGQDGYGFHPGTRLVKRDLESEERACPRLKEPSIPDIVPGSSSGCYVTSTLCGVIQRSGGRGEIGDWLRGAAEVPAPDLAGNCGRMLQVGVVNQRPRS